MKDIDKLIVLLIELTVNLGLAVYLLSRSFLWPENALNQIVSRSASTLCFIGSFLLLFVNTGFYSKKIERIIIAGMPILQAVVMILCGVAYFINFK